MMLEKELTVRNSHCIKIQIIFMGQWRIILISNVEWNRMIITVEIGLGQNQIRRERVVLEGRSQCTHWGREEQKVQKNSWFADKFNRGLPLNSVLRFEEVRLDLKYVWTEPNTHWHIGIPIHLFAIKGRTDWVIMILPWDMTWNACIEYKKFLNWCGDICHLTEVSAIISYHLIIIFSCNRSEKSFTLWTIDSIWLRLHQWRSLKITVRKFNVYLNWNPIKSRYICIVHHTLEKLTKSRSVKCSAILHATRLNEINIKRNMKSHIIGKVYFINTTLLL